MGMGLGRKLKKKLIFLSRIDCCGDGKRKAFIYNIDLIVRFKS